MVDLRYTSFPADMARLVSAIRLLSVCGITAYIPHRYHFVNENKTWSEAQNYCRVKYTDLATINNMEEMKKLNNTLNMESVTMAWIGLQSRNVGEWKWSLGNQTFYINGDDYRNWKKGEPNNILGNEFCVDMAKDGTWYDDRCDWTLAFVCYEGRTNPNNYIFINDKKTWYEAQTYCREKYTDLVSVRNKSENDQIRNLIPTSLNAVWIGLFYDSWKWSDQSKSSFRYWIPNKPIVDLKCAAVNKSDQYYWNTVNCTLTFPFICYEEILVVIKMSVSWWDALRYCREFYHDLVSVRTEEMQVWVKEAALKASTQHVWLGLRYDCVQRIWFWVCGSMLCYQDWAPGNGTWDGDCSTYRRSGAIESGGDQQWMELPETYKLNFICSTIDDLFY